MVREGHPQEQPTLRRLCWDLQPDIALPEYNSIHLKSLDAWRRIWA
jgi:hypothetical protein